MLIYCTYCSAKKRFSEEKLPAIELYLSERITEIFKKAEKYGVKFVILSGKYGIVEPDQKIPYYDHLLLNSEVEKHSKLVASQLKDKNITKIIFYIGDLEKDKNIQTYINSISKASKKMDIPIIIKKSSFND